MTDRDLTRRRVLALSGAAVGAALGVGISSCSAKDPKPGGNSGSAPTGAPGTPGNSAPSGRDPR
ncbi:twin-arginine translocation signal domain-containing protein [Streptomyces aureus]|uniref:twin-arginine translocation signal domain-containing protein n=1 Tax=Streptomyces aureus TaxID=193461 RepID=UPI00099D4D47|nr:twin-arginine translocation signal domain-containing protein [Streptomyces aureus]